MGGRDEKAVYTTDLVRIQVEPGVWMTMYILIPENARNRKDGRNCEKTGNQEKDQRPSCVIAPPGHQGAGKYSVAGCRDIPAVKKMIDHYHYDYGITVAGMLTWDLMRLVDYIEKRDEWDLENIGCVRFIPMG